MKIIQIHARKCFGRQVSQSSRTYRIDDENGSTLAADWLRPDLCFVVAAHSRKDLRTWMA